MSTAVAQELTFADVLRQLGGIAPRRIRFRPAPGTATEDDVSTPAQGEMTKELRPVRVNQHLAFTASTWDDYQWFPEHDRKLLKRINQLIQDSRRTPFQQLELDRWCRTTARHSNPR